MRLPVVWAAGLCCAACSGETIDPFSPVDSGIDPAGGTNGGGSGGSAAGGDSSGGGAGGASASGGSGASTGAGDGGDVPAGEGFLFVYQDPSGYRLIGSFQRWGPSPPCTFRSVGPCRIDRCTEVVARASAGDVTVSAGALRRTATVSDDTYSGDWIGQLWQPGQTVRFVATGADAPALDESVVGPAPITVLEPVLSAMSVVISRTEPTRVRWSGASSGSAVFAVSGTTTTSELLQVKCSFDAARGEGLIPPEALSDLDPSAAVDLVTFAEGYKSLTVSDWLVRVAARTETIAATVVLQ